MTQLAKLLTVKDLAAALGVHERSVWRLSAEAEAGRGDFPSPLRIGPKTIRWRVADVEAYLASLAAGSGRGNKSRYPHNPLAPGANRR